MPFFRQCSENYLRSTHSTREAKIRSFCILTLSLEPWKSRHFGLLSRPGPCRSESVLFLACSQFWRPSYRDDTAAGNVASLTFTRKCLLRAFDCGCGNGFLFSRRPPWKSRHFGLLSRPGPCRSESVLFLACSQFWRPSYRDDTAAGNVASLTLTRKCLLRAFDCGCGNGFLFSRRPRPVSDRCRSFASVRLLCVCVCV